MKETQMINPKERLREYLDQLIHRFLNTKSLFQELNRIYSWYVPGRVETINLSSYFFQLSIYSMTRIYLVELAIMLSEKWLELIENWLLSENLQTKKIGVSALTRLIQNKKFDYFPKIFRLLTPLFSEPKIEIRHDLMEIVTAMISRTEPETASFLISIAKLHANDENRVFIRKCLPLFNTNLQDEIKDAL